MKNEVQVSVVMLAYNHGEFIKEAIESILSQKVNFSYEIIIGEDYSPDNTREIIFEFQKKYPEIIKPIIRDNNVGSTRNLYEALLKCKGDYIACLEGDDFWTDSHKLQKQFDFLNNNPDFIAVAHRNSIVDRNGENIGYSNQSVPINTTISHKDLLKYTTNLAHPSSMFHRNIFKNSDEDFSIIAESNKYGTHFMMLSLMISRGSMYMMDSYMSAWRCIVSESATNYTSMAMKNPLEAAENYFVMIKNFKTYFGDHFNYTNINAKQFGLIFYTVLKFANKEKRYLELKKFSGYLDTKEKALSIIYIFTTGSKILFNKVKKIAKGEIRLNS